MYTVLFKSPKSQSGRGDIKQVGNIQPLAIDPDFHRALETSYEASMVAWMALVGYLYQKCQDDPVLKAACTNLAAAI